MRVVVVGATGNVGTSLLERLQTEPTIDRVVGVARRLPEASFEGTEWAPADITRDDLEPIFNGADAVVHLAWLIQPSRDLGTLHRTNVLGSERVFRAAVNARVPSLIYASSIGAYSPGPKKRRITEEWPTGGIRTSFYSRHKAATERMLDRLEQERPEMRIVRLRKGLIFKRDAATGIRRLFFGPLVPNKILDRRLIPVVPDMKRFAFQAVHSMDVAEAYRLALVSDARGPFNVAAEPVLDAPALAGLLGARRLPIPAALLRILVQVSWWARLHPTPPGWLDLALGAPLMDTSRARSELGWEPRHTSGEALLELLEGLRDAASFPTPPLDVATTAPLRIEEFRTGIGGRP
jgi:nucleoside-diphosphate-sugar epimerase